MARGKKQTAADKAAITIESIKTNVRDAVQGWKSRPVPRQMWHDAHDELATLYPLNPSEWQRLELLLCEQFEQWIVYTAAA
jgi:phage terminase small subunit